MTAPKMSEVFELPLADDPACEPNLRVSYEEAVVATIRAVNAHDPLVDAIKRQCANIDHWLETGEAASPEESKSIYDQMVAALALGEGRS